MAYSNLGMRRFTQNALKNSRPILATWVALYSIGIASCIAYHGKQEMQVPVPLMLLEDAANKTVALSRNGPYGDEKMRILCGGVYVSEHEILTANHCVENTVWCTNDDGNTVKRCKRFPSKENAKRAIMFYTHDQVLAGDKELFVFEPEIATVTRTDKVADLALLTTKHASTYGYAHVAPDVADKGDDAFIVGHPGGKPYKFVHAKVADSYWVDETVGRGKFHRFVIELNVRVQGGTSGGGAWNSRGELIGICLTRSLHFEQSYFAASKSITKFLSK